MLLCRLGLAIMNTLYKLTAHISVCVVAYSKKLLCIQIALSVEDCAGTGMFSLTVASRFGLEALPFGQNR